MMKRWLLPVLAVTGLSMLSSGEAAASALERHRSQVELFPRMAERPLTIGRGWLSVGLGFHWKHSRSEFTPGGDAAFRTFENDATWDYRVIDLNLAWGFSKNSTLFMRIPWVIPTIANSFDVNVTGFSLGDIEFGVLFQLLRTMDEENRRFSNSLAFQAALKTNTGNESPGGYLGGAGNLTNIITGTGTQDLDLRFLFRQQLAVLGIEAQVGYNFRFGGIVQYLIDTEENQFNQTLDLGDQINFGFDLIVSPVDQFHLVAGIEGSYNFLTRAGSGKSTIPSCRDCPAIDGSDGIDLALDARVGIVPHQQIEIGLDFNYTLLGRRMFLWPLESASPARGFTAGGDFAVRF